MARGQARFLLDQLHRLHSRCETVSITSVCYCTLDMPYSPILCLSSGRNPDCLEAAHTKLSTPTHPTTTMAFTGSDICKIILVRFYHLDPRHSWLEQLASVVASAIAGLGSVMETSGHARPRLAGQGDDCTASRGRNELTILQRRCGL